MSEDKKPAAKSASAKRKPASHSARSAKSGQFLTGVPSSSKTVVASKVARAAKASIEAKQFTPRRKLENLIEAATDITGGIEMRDVLADPQGGIAALGSVSVTSGGPYEGVDIKTGEAVADVDPPAIDLETLREPLTKGEAYLVFDALREVVVKLASEVQDLAPPPSPYTMTEGPSLALRVAEFNRQVNALIGGVGPEIVGSSSTRRQYDLATGDVVNTGTGWLVGAGHLPVDAFTFRVDPTDREEADESRRPTRMRKEFASTSPKPFGRTMRKNSPRSWSVSNRPPESVGPS